MKKRLDVVLVERGLAESRTQAQALVIAGRVPGYDKPGTQVDENAELSVDEGQRFVSRGGEKLAHALDAFGVDRELRVLVDLSAGLVVAGHAAGHHERLRLRAALRQPALDEDNVKPLLQAPSACGLVSHACGSCSSS